MRDLSLTQEYMILSLNEKGKYPVVDTARPMGLVAGAVMELEENGFAEIDEDTINLKREPDADHAYLKPVYEVILGLKKKKTLQKLVEAYTTSFSAKEQKHLQAAVKESLSRAGTLEEVKIQPLLRKEQTHLVPRPESIERIVQKIRTEFLEDQPMADETIALAALLHKNGLLKQYFSKHESGELKKRLEEIKHSDSNQVVKKTLGYLEAIESAYVAIIATTLSQ